MSHVEILSGLGRKSSAAIRVHHQGNLILLDAGGPLHPDEPCDWPRHTGPVDAILISHDHPDHIGSVSRLPKTIPLYCTPEVATALPAGRHWHPLPSQGTRSILGIKVTTGRAGHSHGGVWLHLDVCDGLFYSGDASFESLIFPFDTPPPAGTLLLDASYGLYDADQAHCQAAILNQLAKPTVLPLPLTGRAIELAVWLSGLDNEHSVDWTMDSHCQLALRQLIRSSPDIFQTGVYEVLQRLTSQHWPERASIMLVADQNDGYLDWPDHQVLHTGYLTPERRRRVAAGVELWRRWNVHFRASDLVQLRDSLNARQVVPLFTMLNPKTAWQARLGPSLHTDTTLDLNHETDTKPFYFSAPR